MKKNILILITLLLASVNTVWGQNICKVGDTEYATIQAAIDAIAQLQTPTGTITLTADVTDGAGFGSFLASDNHSPAHPNTLTVTIDFNGHNYEFGKDFVGSSNTPHQCMHFETPHTFTLTNNSNNPATLSVKSGATENNPRMMLQNYANLTINNLNINCSNIVKTTYPNNYTGDDAYWNGKTRPVFNFNKGTSTITGSTITFSNGDEFGIAADQRNSGDNGTVTIGNGTTVNGNVTVIAGTATAASGSTITGNVVLANTNGTLTVESGATVNGTVKSEVNKEITDNASVAKIVSNNVTYNYATLQAAFDAANSGETVTLLQDISTTTVATTSLKNVDNTAIENVHFIIPQDKNITLDLNGKTITGEKTVLMNAGTLTLTSSVDGGKIKSNTGNGVRCYSNSNTTIQPNVTIESKEMSVLTGKSTNATLTINGGTFTATDNAVLGDNGTNGCTGNTITVNGGTFNGGITSSGYIACGIYAANNDTWTINGGTFNITGGAGIVQRAGTVNVTGGTFICTGTNEGKVGDKSTALPSSALVYDNSTPTYPGQQSTAILKVTGGSFTSDADIASGVDGTGDHIEISGGTFNKQVEQKYCAPGYFGPTATVNGKYVVEGPYDAKINQTGYAAFVDAATEAGTEGTIVIDLLRDIATPYTLAQGKKLTVQDNGYSVTIKAQEGFEIKTESTTTGVTTYSVVKSINGSTISVIVDPASYTGSAITPNVTVKEGDAVLVKDQDYTISLYPATFTDAKTYSQAITIMGKGNFGGIRKADFTISQKPISECNISATAEYTGNAIETYTVVVKNGNTTLVEGADKDYTYTVTGTFTNVGTYENVVTVTGHNNYTGTTTVDLVVGTGTSIADALVTATAVYNGQNQPPTVENITVKVGSATLTANDYDVAIAGTASDYKDAKTYSNAITITAKGSTYYGKVKANYVIEQCDLTNAKVKAKEDAKMVWTGNEIELKINTNEGNNVTLKLVATEDDPNTTDVNEEVSYKLEANTDYTYTANPTPFKEAGEYTVTFEGRGNFKGTLQLTVHVEKVVSNLTIEENQRFIITGNDYTNFDITKIDFKVKDGDKELVKGTDYTVEIYPYDENGTVATEAVNAITNDCAIKVKFTGIGDYSGSKEENAFLLNEYYPRGGKALGYDGATALNTDIRLFIDDNSALTAKLGNQTESAVIASDLEVLTMKNNQDGWTARIPFKTGTEANNVTNFDIPLTGIEAGAFKNCTNLTGIDLFYVPTITEIENGAFEGCTNLRYIDLADAMGYTPTSLQRNIAASPFYGVPKQALVYLNGTTFKGENYVYKPGAGTGLDYYCELFKVYDDMSGTQTQYSETNGYKWAFENRHNFTAYTIENTRMMKAGQHYTVCLPYDLPTPEDVKVYTLEASSDQILGFKEVKPTTLGCPNSPWLPIPYVLIPSVSGKLLNATNCIVHEFKEENIDDESKLNTVTSAGNTQFAMSGTMRYISGPEAEGIYIMQGDNTWKMIRGTNGYSSACVLPMRAYIQAVTNNGGARLTMTFTDADGSTTAIDGLQFDADDAQEVYDLQGRRVKNPIKGRIYIVNGEKRMMK